MKKLLFLFFVSSNGFVLFGQNSADTVKQELLKRNADDPSQFLTRVEFFNELHHYDKNGTDFYLNQTTVRTILKLGKRFTTRIDLPFVYNSVSNPANYKQFGIGDISFRLLGYKFLESRLSAFTASVEISMNTAQSPILGTGKNVIIPVITYTHFIPKKKILFSLLFQQAHSIWGEEARADISFSKLQVILVRYWSPKTWSVLSPEWYLDYINGGVSMNLRTRMTYAPVPRINIWITPGAGIFGDFTGRYQWSADIGGRYFLLREKKLKQRTNE